MRSISRKGLEVFDFKDEDERVESTAGKFTGRFKNPSSDHSPLTKYNFLEHFARASDAREMNVSDVSCIDVDASYGDQECKNHGSYALDASEGKCAIKEGISGLDENLVSNCITSKERAHSNSDNSLPGNMLPGCMRVSSCATDTLRLGEPFSDNQQLNCSIPELPSNNKPVDVNSDDDESGKASLQSTHSSDIRENEGSSEDSASDHSLRGWTMENNNTEVVVAPDYLIYGDRYCTESSLTFSCSGIRLEGRNACGSKEFLFCEWAIIEIDEIKSQWFARVETALVKLCIRSTPEVGAKCPDGTSGCVELKFAICDSCWFKTHERIMTMDARYRAVWKVLLDTHAKEEDDLIGNGACHSNGYFSNFDEPFEDVVYPKGDPDAVSISKRDVELLQPETFINDTIIDFYIKYLKNKIQPEDRHRFHFFNSFFFRKLADMDKDPSSASEGRAAFLRVRKWTRKVNLFEKDYLFIPVNFNLHWSLIIVCHPGEAVSFRDEDIGMSPKVPCILHMDSIKGSHKGLKNLVQSYLWEEWKERQIDSAEDVSSKFFNLRFVHLELPQQENSFDCGLFLLHYVELFLEEAPVYFNPFKITEFSSFLNMDWFPPGEASLKRAHIQKLIFELLEDHSQKMPPDASDGCCHSSHCMENDTGEENGVELILERNSPAKEGNGAPSYSLADQGIEIKLLTSLGDTQHVRDPGLIFRELLEPGTSTGSSQDEQLQSFDLLSPFHRFKAVMSPVEEDEENDRQFAYLPSGGADCSRLAEITADGCATSFTSKNFGMFDSICNPGRTMQEDEHEGDGSSTETASFMSQSSSEVAIDEHPAANHFVQSNQQEEMEKPSLTSLENVGCTSGSPVSASSKQLEACIVEDSQEDDRITESEESKDSFSPCQENPPDISSQLVGLDENENLQMNCNDDTTSESNEERAAKRIRVAHDLEKETAVEEV